MLITPITPDEIGTAQGDARATLALVEKLASWHGGPISGTPGPRCLYVPEGSSMPERAPSVSKRAPMRMI